MTSPTVYVIKNQSGQFLNKHSEWIEGGESAALYRTMHRDEAVNTVFEVSSKDIYLRAEVVACGVDSKGQPALDAVPPPFTAHADEPAAANAPVENSPVEEVTETENSDSISS